MKGKIKSNQNESGNSKISMSLKVKTTNSKLSWWSKFRLLHKGKKDGKKNIPYIDSRGYCISPTIQEESNSVLVMLSNVYSYLNRKNTDCYIMTETAFSEFEQRALEIERLHNFLKEKMKQFDEPINISVVNQALTEEVKEMLNSKRESEKDLEPIGIRLRRFREYQRQIEPFRKQFVIARKKLEQDFENVSKCAAQVELIDEQLRIISHKFYSVANTRLSWYWQGVLKKHKQKDQFKSQIPRVIEADFDTIYGTRLKDIKKRVSDAKKTRDQLLSLEIV